jgi:hypothetical protein
MTASQRPFPVFSLTVAPPPLICPNEPVGWTAAASLEAEESPGSIRTRRRITSGGGDPRDSATESKPPGRAEGSVG